MMSDCLRSLALEALCLSDPDEKIQAVARIEPASPIDNTIEFHPSAPIPGRPLQPELVDPKQVGMRSVHTPEGRATLLHAIAHIEFNAINLALDIMWRFPHFPKQYYLDWLQVAKEEAYHFDLVRQRLRDLAYDYGDFTAHNGLWEMAEKTKTDRLARLALVPRTLEARGLDVNPGMQKKFREVNDTATVEVLEIILRDEVGHVDIGNRWYLYQCEQEGLDPVARYAKLFEEYGVAKPRGPFNEAARMQAGFSQEEMDWLNASI